MSVLYLCCYFCIAAIFGEMFRSGDKHIVVKSQETSTSMTEATMSNDEMKVTVEKLHV